jgi:acyl-CoA synthetase (AMP-forming)/AMP-acid ligase II
MGYNISDYISELAEQKPHQPAIKYPGEISFIHLQQKIDCMVAWFREEGLKSGDRTLILVKPGEQMFSLVFSLLRMGSIPVLIDPGMGIKNMAKSIRKIRIDAFVGIPNAHLLRILYPSAFKSCRLYFSTEPLLFAKAHVMPKLYKQECQRVPSVLKPGDAEIAILFTSGSTGPAKAVKYSNMMFIKQIEILNSYFDYQSGGTDCCTFPLTSLLALCLGQSVVFADMNMTRPATLDSEKLIDNLKDNACSHLFCSPMVLKKLVSHAMKKKVHLPELKQVITAGAPVSVSLLKDFRSYIQSDTKIHTPYGATEALPLTSIFDDEILMLDQLPGQGVCVGNVLSDIQLKIIEISDLEMVALEDTKEIPKGQVGEILVKGDIVSQEYLSMRNTHYSKVVDHDGRYWHRMGDLGKLDENDRLWLYGRKSHRVETSNKTLFTIPVESVFNAHPLVNRSALVGKTIPGKEYEHPVICLETKKILNRKQKSELLEQLRVMADKAELSIHNFYFIKKFPVDPRHNAKIAREKLKNWINR